MGDKYDYTNLEQLQNAAKNPAAPTGLQQTATAGTPAGGSKYDYSNLQQLAGDRPSGSEFVDAAQSWYTGANLEDPENGWSTDFMQTAFEQQAQAQQVAMESQDPTKVFDWYKRDDATGVIGWNDPAGNLWVGDVFQDGKKVGNVYDDFGRQGGDLMMLRFTTDGATQARIFEDPDRNRLIHEEVKKFTEESTSQRKSATDRMAFDDAVEARQQKLIDGSGDEWLTAGGFAGGAAVGAGIGTIVPGLGNLVGAAAGALVFGIAGAIGADKNQDLLTEQFARAQEITSLANKKYGDGAAFSTGMKEYSAVAMRLINPVSNIVQGAYDAKAGTVGDGESEFYAYDENAERKRPGWVQVADIGATVLDSALQFGNPLGIGLYMTATGASVLGSVGTMAQTGAGWNDRTASFDTYEGAKENLAAAGNVGIDLLQLGFAGALAKAGTAARSAVATSAAPSLTQRAIAGLTPWRAAGTEVKTINGMRFTLDAESGVALKARPAMTILAPSEAARWVPTAWRARNRAALSSGAAGPDDYYRAALEMAGGNRFGYAVINGWAEGSEEAVQAVLEPTSFSADLNTGQIAEAYFYGMAAGAGMSLGRVSAPPLRDDVLKFRAKTLYEMRNQTGPLSEEEWNGIWSRTDKDSRKRMAVASNEETAAIQEALRAFQAMQTVDQSKSSTLGVLAYQDLTASAFARDLARINPNGDSVLQLASFSGDKVLGPNGESDVDLFSANSGVLTAWRATQMVVANAEGIRVQVEDVLGSLKDAEAELAAAVGNDVETEKLQTRIAELEIQSADLNGILEVSKSIVEEMTGLYKEWYEADSLELSDQVIDRMNGFLSLAFQGKLPDQTGTLFDERVQELVRRSVEIKFLRHPTIGKDSYVILKPQVSKSLTAAKAHGQIHTHQGMLKALGGDRDGDTGVTQNFMYLPPGQLNALRAGTQYLPSIVEKVEIGKAANGEPVFEDQVKYELVIDAPDFEASILELMKEAFSDPSNTALHGVADHAVSVLHQELYDRYTGTVPEQVLLKLLEDFRAEVVRGDENARMHLANGLFNAAPKQLGFDFGRDNGQPEVMWLWQRISLEWDRFQRAFAANEPENEYTPAAVDAPKPGSSAYLRSRAMESAASDGQSMAMAYRGSDPVRIAQKPHFSFFRAATTLAKGDFTTAAQDDFVELYAVLGSGMNESELQRVRGREAIQKRVALWLEKISKEWQRDNSNSKPLPLMVLANTQVRDVRSVGLNKVEIIDGDITLLQLLLRRSVEIEEARFRETIDQDPELQKKVDRLERLTRRDPNDKNRSTTAELALFEVFGAYPLFDLLGDESAYISPQLTMNQLSAFLADMTDVSRQEQVYRWKRKAPYLLHEKLGNPPYTEEESTSGKVSAYKVVVGAIVANAQTAPRTRTDRDKVAYDQFVSGINSLQRSIQTFREINTKTLKDTRSEAILEQLLKQNPRELGSVIVAIIPDAAKLGAFQRSEITGEMYAAPWVMKMLTQPAEQAALTYFVQSKLAEWNQMGGDLDLEGRETDPDTGEKKAHAVPHPRAYGKIKSRFLQTIYHLAQQPDGFELDRLVLAMSSATSLPALMEQINSEPMWRGDRAELKPFYDDVREFDADPSQMWNVNLPGQLQREALQNFSQRTRIFSAAMVEYAQELETEQTLLDNIKHFMEGKGNRDEGEKYAGLIEQALRNRVMFSDHAGPRMRDAALTRIQSGILRMHDKGKADPAVAPMGEILVTTDEFGVKQSVMQTEDALTKYDFEDIETNPTLLADGPVEVGLSDGSAVVLDFTSLAGIHAALSNPLTNAFAKQVLLPTARDVNTVGVTQHYLDVSRLSLKTALDETDFGDVFVPIDDRLSLAQANKYISMLEAGVRKAAIGKSESEQKAAYFPIQNILNEFIIAYSHKVGANTQDLDAVRSQLIIDVATALQAVAALGRGGQVLLDELRLVMQGALEKRYENNGSTLRDVLGPAISKATEDVMRLDAEAHAYTLTANKLKDALADPNLDPAERVQVQAQFDRLTKTVKERVARLEQLGKSTTVQSTIAMFTLTGDPKADLERKAQIRDFLKPAHRIGRFQGNYKLWDKASAMLAYSPTAVLDDTKITDEEWNELGTWAATAYLAELSGRAGSSMDLTPVILGDEGAEMRRFFDPSWSYLLDGLFKPQLLSVAQEMAKQAQWDVTMTPAAVAQILDGSLFNQQKLGSYTELIVYSSLQARKALAQAPVGLAIPASGVLPMTQGAYSGASRLTFRGPPAEALTTMDPISVNPFDNRIPWTEEQFFKLNNHFAGRVVLKGISVNGDLEVDILARIGQAWIGEKSVEDSQYKVISIQRLNEAIAEALLDNDFAGNPVLQIDYFDVDTMPFTREWANNIYYVGVGRDSALSSAVTPNSEMIFAAGGISKQGQQGPLDTATKDGKGYQATRPVPRSDVLEIEADSTTVAELLRKKALLELNREYDIGKLLPTDSTTLYNRMKQRHVVIGKDADGNKQVWWAGRAIEWETANGLPISDPSFPLSGAYVFALSDRQAQRLLGEPGVLGTAGVVQMPLLNLDEMDNFPELTPERLKELKMERLGERSTLDSLPFSGPLQRLAWTSDRESDRLTRHQQQIKKFRQQQVTMRTARVRDNNIPITKINKRNARKLRDWLGTEALAPLFARLNIPFSGIRDMAEVQLSKYLMQKVQDLARVNPSSVIWQHVHGASFDLAKGVFSEVVTDNGFSELKDHEAPGYEDIAIIDLDAYMTSLGNDYTLAYDLAKKAIQAYAKRGVTIVLAHSKAGTTLRTDLARYLKQGAEGYDQMSESAHFFAPINPASGANQSRRALESSLLSVQQISPESITLAFNSDRFGDASSENASLKEYWEGGPEPRTEGLTLVPTEISHIYGKPVKGVGALDQMSHVRERMLEMLESPQGRALLHKLGGDPKGVPIHRTRVRKDGTVVVEPGIRSLSDAMDRLKGLLQSGTHPLTVGKDIMIGDLIPLLGADGSILLMRFGFVAPNVQQLAEMVATEAENPKSKATMAARVAISPAELEETWVTRSPSTIMSIDPDRLVGARMIVRYTQDWPAKDVDELDAFKSVPSPMPNDLAGPVEDISTINKARVRVFRSRVAPEKKQAITGKVNNFRWLFALSGFDFRSDMVDYVLGKKVRSEDEYDQALADVTTFLTELSNLDTGYTATQLTEMLDANSFIAVMGAQMNQLAAETLGSEVFDISSTSTSLFRRPTDPLDRLGQVLLASLMAPNVKVDDVLKGAGILSLEDMNTRANIPLVPEIFSDNLDDYNYPELREMLFDRSNAAMPTRPDGSKPYVIRPDWKFQIRMRDPRTGEDEEGYTSGQLQMILQMPADENSTTYTQAGIRRGRTAVSQHVTMTAWQALGGHVATERDLVRTKKIFSTEGIERFSDSDSGGFWQLLRAVPKEDSSYKPWMKQTPLQKLWIQGAHVKVAHYLKPFSLDPADQDEYAAYRAVQSKIMEELNINSEVYRAEIDYLVRQFIGRPAAHPDQDPEIGTISGATAHKIAELILTNVRKNRIPTYGGVVPLMGETILKLIFQANEGLPKPWAPTMGAGRKAKYAKNWNAWVETTFGQVLESKELFDSAFRQDLDGFMHTYQAATKDLLDTPVSMDEDINVKLMDKDANMFVASLDPLENSLLTEPIILETMKATLDAIVGQDQAATYEAARTAGTSDLAKTLEKHAAWIRSKQLPRQEQMSMKHYAEEGAWYIESSRDTHMYFHNVVNLSVGVRLLNPALWTSAVVEVWVRMGLEGLANVLQGKTKMLAGAAEGLGVEQSLTKLDRVKFDKLAESMGQDNRFLAVVYDELMYRNMLEAGSGKKLSNKLESFARFSAKATSDPKFGMVAKAIAKRYLETAWEYIDRTDNAITVNTFIGKMNRDPLYLAKEFEPNRVDALTRVPFNPHRAGLNAIAQVRSVKASVSSTIIMGGIDALARNPKFRYNALGHLIKIPFLFTRFNANALTTMTGMGGADQFFAMFFDQRQSPLLGRIKAGMSGREYNSELHDPIDLTDVIEGIDLVRPFLKGAITHTGLMTFAMMAGGLGLSGEDDESKRRRRIAEYLGTPYYYDPRQAQNDFTNADAVFMEFLPGPLESMFRFAPGVDGAAPRSASTPHWIFRQFLSPVIGIERFFETGDVRQIKWGFADAFSVLPNSVSRLWKEAELTGDMLAESAKHQDEMGTPRNTGNATQFLINVVGVYERALFELSFVNAWRNGADKYDRDPWTLPMKTPTGEIKYDPNTQAPLQTDTRVQYIDEETGEIREGYASRGDWSARLHQFAENNFTAAAVLSLTTGQWGTDSSFWRKNMVPSVQELELPPTTRAEAEAFLLSALDGVTKAPGTLPQFSLEEIDKALKAREQAAGRWWNQDEITAEAKKVFAEKGGELVGAMSLWDKDNKEVLTKAGAEGIYWSLSKGMVKVGDPSLRGVSISKEMRMDIAKDWIRDLVQEGLDLGLDDYAATARMKRLWYGGGFDEPDAVGLEDLIFSDQVPLDSKVKYNQLNTTFTLGPDGRPWATPWGRGNFVQALGIPWPNRAVMSDQGGLTVDSAGNTVDSLVGIDTGLKALERMESSWQIKTPEGLMDEALKKPFAPSKPFGDKSGSGWQDFGNGWKNFGSGWKNYGGGGGGGGGGGAYFTKMYGLPQGTTPYGNTIPFINTTNPIIRRAFIRRERVESERGRLKQWQ